MKVARPLILLCASTGLTAGQFDPRLLRLIGPDAKYVSAGDFERYQASKLSLRPFHQVYIEGEPPRFRLEIGTEDRRTLYVTVTSIPISPPDPDTPAVVYRGVRTWTAQGVSHATPDPTIELYGEDKIVQEAIDRWQDAKAPLSPLAAKAQGLSFSYDAWFIMTTPLAVPEFAGFGPRSPRIEELAHAIGEVRAGLRFGRVLEAVVEIDAKSPEEASALAVFGRYLPALLETRSDPQSQVFKLADRVVSQSHGSTAMLSLSIDERHIEEAARKYAATIVE
jgi:hypothetical protein